MTSQLADSKTPEITGALACVTPLVIHPLEESIQRLQEATASVINVFDKLQAQSAEIMARGEGIGTTEAIKSLRRHLQKHDRNHQKKIEELHHMLEVCVEKKLAEYLQERAKEEIEHEIDELVRNQVAEHLRLIIPDNLQNTLVQQKDEMKYLRIKLQNSENRCSNASLRCNRPDDSLQVIYMTNGKVSQHYPKSLKDILNLDGEAAKILMLDYNLLDVSEDRDRNINQLLQFCGVRYQIIGCDTRHVEM